MKLKLVFNLFIFLSFSAFSQEVLDYKLFDLWGNSQWNLTAKETYAYDNNDSVVERLYQSWNQSTNSYFNQNRIISRIDSSGNYVVRFYDFWNLDLETWNRGIKVETTYNAVGNISLQVLNKKNNNKWQPEVKYVNHYNSYENITLTEKISWDYSTNAWSTGSAKIKYYYDANQNLIEMSQGSKKTYCTYNALNQKDSTYSGEFINTVWRPQISTSFKYNNQGVLYNRNTFRFHPTQNHIIKEFREEYVYNPNGEIIEKLTYEYDPLILLSKRRTRYFYKKSFSQIPFSGTLLIFPQPAATTLNFVNNVNGISYKIFSMNGSEIQSGKLLTGVNIFDVSNFPRGIYVLEVYSANNVWSEKILISP